MHSARKDLDDQDMITVLERCYNVLHGRRNSNASSAASTATIKSIASSHSILSRHTRRYVFDSVRTRVTRLDHNLYDVIWPSVKKLPTDGEFRNHLESDLLVGIIAPDFAAYHVFAELMLPIIKDANNMDPHIELLPHPKTKFVQVEELDDNNETEKINDPDLVNEDDCEEVVEKTVAIDLDLDVSAKNIISGRVECTRNLDTFELPNNLSVGELEHVERLITTVLLSAEVAQSLYPNATEDEIRDKGNGIYYTMNEILEEPSEARIILASNGLLIPLWNIPDSDRLHGKHWPYGRGVFVSNSYNLAVWINVLDHIRVVTVTSPIKPGNVGQIYTRLYKLVNCLQTKLSFVRDEYLGYLSARPTAVGNTIQFNFNIRFPHLIKEPENFRYLCNVRGLNYFRNAASADIVRIGNKQCLSITELQCFEDFSTAVANILQLEKDMAMSSSLHIAALFVNMFKRKKNGHIES